MAFVNVEIRECYQPNQTEDGKVVKINNNSKIQIDFSFEFSIPKAERLIVRKATDSCINRNPFGRKQNNE